MFFMVLGFVEFLLPWLVWTFQGGGVNYNGGENKQRMEQNGTWPVVTWESFIHYWCKGNFCFLCLRMFRRGGAENKLWTDKCGFIREGGGMKPFS